MKQHQSRPPSTKKAPTIQLHDSLSMMEELSAMLREAVAAFRAISSSRDEGMKGGKGAMALDDSRHGASSGPAIGVNKRRRGDCDGNDGSADELPSGPASDVAAQANGVMGGGGSLRGESRDRLSSARCRVLEDPHLLQLILEYAAYDVTDLTRLSVVCRMWRDVTMRDDCGWKQITKEEFGCTQHPLIDEFGGHRSLWLSVRGADYRSRWGLKGQPGISWMEKRCRAYVIISDSVEDDLLLQGVFEVDTVEADNMELWLTRGVSYTKERRPPREFVSMSEYLRAEDRFQVTVTLLDRLGQHTGAEVFNSCRDEIFMLIEEYENKVLVVTPSYMVGHVTGGEAVSVRVEFRLERLPGQQGVPARRQKWRVMQDSVLVVFETEDRVAVSQLVYAIMTSKL